MEGWEELQTWSSLERRGNTPDGEPKMAALSLGKVLESSAYDQD
jgi:hypothetical protein